MYYLYSFDGALLPTKNTEYDFSSPDIPDTTTEVVNGFVDYTNGRRLLPGKHSFGMAGNYVGIVSYLVDESGNILVDSLGNTLVDGTPTSNIVSQLREIHSKIGKRGTLIRKRNDISTVQHKNCKLVAVGREETDEYQYDTVRISLDFLATKGVWTDASATTKVTSLPAGATPVQVINAGEIPITDLTFSFYTTDAISSITIAGDDGTELVYAASVAAGKTLRIDCEKEMVTVDGAPAYIGFSLGGGHEGIYWCNLPPLSTTTFTVTVDAVCQLTITHTNKYL